MSRFRLVGQHRIDNQQNDINIEIWIIIKKVIEKFRRSFFVYLAI